MVETSIGLLLWDWAAKLKKMKISRYVYRFINHDLSSKRFLLRVEVGEEQSFSK